MDGPFVGEAVTGKSWIACEPATTCTMVAGLVQQREDQCIFADEWMEGETAIKTYKTRAANVKRLSVHDPSLHIDFIFDAGERGPKLRHKSFQHSATAFRAAKGDVVRQDGCVQHGVPNLIFPKLAELEPFTDKAMGG